MECDTKCGQKLKQGSGHCLQNYTTSYLTSTYRFRTCINRFSRVFLFIIRLHLFIFSTGDHYHIVFGYLCSIILYTRPHHFSILFFEFLSIINVISISLHIINICHLYFSVILGTFRYNVIL